MNMKEKVKRLVDDFRMEHESNHPMFQKEDIEVLEYVRGLIEEIELKESEYQATISKLHRATKLVRDYQQQNTDLVWALRDILHEAYEEAGLDVDSGMQLESYIAKTAREVLEKYGLEETG